MTLGGLRKLFRQRTDDVSAPFLWSDPEIDGFINDAQREAAERALLIFDKTSAVTQIAFTAGVMEYDLDRRILKIRRAIIAAPNKRPLERTTKEWLDCNYPGWRNGQTEPHYFIEEVQGALATFTLARAASYAGTVQLDVYRLPLEDMAAPDDELEIDPKLAVRMMDWAYHLAYSRRDAETYDEDKAKSYDAAFTRSFGEKKTADVARQHREAREHVTTMNPGW